MRVSRLTQREREVMDFIGRGLSTRDIARQLNIAPAAARRHVASAARRLRTLDEGVTASDVRERGLRYLEKGERPRFQLTLSFLAILLGGWPAVHVGSFFSSDLFCSTDRLAGARIEHASDLVIVSGAIAVIALLVTRNRPRLFGTALLAQVPVLTVGIVMVASDGAFVRTATTCSLFDAGTPSLSSADVSYLYGFWSAAAVLLVSQGVRGVRGAR
jgi:hypothetical protein